MTADDGEISELPGGKEGDTGGSGHRFPMYTESWKDRKSRRTDRRFRKRTTYTIDTRVCRENLLVAGSLQDRKESENDTFCGSRSGSRRSDHGPWTARYLEQADVVIYAGITGESGLLKSKGDMRYINSAGK